jgi:uncharacterized membrane protein
VLLRVAQNTYNLLPMPRYSSFLVIIVLLVASLTPVGALTSRAQFGKIKVRVVDILGARIVPAQVTIVGEGLRWRMTTNSEGELETSLPIGEYRLSVEAKGFRRVASEKFQIKSGKTQRLNIKLQIQEPEMLVPAVSDPQSDS